MPRPQAAPLRAAAALLLTAGLLAAPAVGPAAAINPPPSPGGPPPADGAPGPEFPTTQNRACVAAGLLPNSDLTQPPPATLSLNLEQAWALSQGAGATVAVIDTGVRPNPRLPNLTGGGDYVSTGGDGLTDCDAHGTLVAGIIGAAPGATDAFEGVAPQARILSIRAKSMAYSAQLPNDSDATAQTSLDVRTYARAIVHAANLGANVIDVSLPICVDAQHPVDQTALGAAVAYAVQVRGAVLIAGAGDTQGNGSCPENPDIDPASPRDPRNWAGVKTISSPGWFGHDVITVGFTSASGTPTPLSLAGPWVSVAAPGTAIESLDPGGGAVVVTGVGSPGQLVPVGGSSFAAAYVAGVAALLRSRFPNETPDQIAARLQAGAHAPARGVDNIVGAGVIDPLASLSYRTAPQPPTALDLALPLAVSAPAPPRDRRPPLAAGVVIGAALLLGVVASYLGASGRRRRG